MATGDETTTMAETSGTGADTEMPKYERHKPCERCEEVEKGLCPIVSNAPDAACPEPGGATRGITWDESKSCVDPECTIAVKHMHVDLPGGGGGYVTPVEMHDAEAVAEAGGMKALLRFPS